MSSKARESVVELEGGAVLRLRFDFNAASIVEELTGLNLLDATNTDRNPTAVEMRAIIFALAKAHAIAHADEVARSNITLEVIGSLMTPATMPSIRDGMAEAVTGKTASERAEADPTDAPEQGREAEST